MFIVYGSDATWYFLTEAAMCGVCRRPHYWFVNRNGRSSCLGCADSLPKLQPETANHEAA